MRGGVSEGGRGQTGQSGKVDHALVLSGRVGERKDG